MKVSPRILFLALFPLTLGVGCGDSREEDGGEYGQIAGCCPGWAYPSKATAYYPAADRMQGGFVDRKGRKLRTLQDFIAGKSEYVSIALDATARPYGTKVCIPEIEKEYGKAIPFKIVDTGGAFVGKGHSRIDVCVRDRKASRRPEVNGQVTLVICDPNS